MTPKQARALQTMREMAAGARCIRRAGNVERLEKLSKKHKIRIEHTLHDSVLVHVLEGHPPLTTRFKPKEKVRVTLVDSGADFPSATLMVQLMLVIE